MLPQEHTVDGRVTKVDSRGISTRGLDYGKDAKKLGNAGLHGVGSRLRIGVCITNNNEQ